MGKKKEIQKAPPAEYPPRDPAAESIGAMGKQSKVVERG